MSKTTKKSTSRVLKQTTTLHHDLYILGEAKMLKDTSIGKTGDPEMMVPVKHQHFFHTIDSTGRTLTECSPIGGHFHEMKVVQGKDGEPPKVVCASGPMQWAKKKVHGKWKRVKVPVNHYDDHTHEVEYLHSEEVTPRKPNVEAAKVSAAQAAKEAGQGAGSTEGLGAIVEG